MDDLTYSLTVLCRRNRDGSHATQADRLRSLKQMARELIRAGFRNMTARSLKPKHVNVLVGGWQARNLSPGTQKNRLAHLRWWAEKIGKPGLIPANSAELGIPEREFVTNENKARTLSAVSLEKVRDLHVRMSLRLQAAFGLRREESIKFQPRYADHGDFILIKGSWAKGGKQRAIPITAPEQRVTLDLAHKLAGAGSLKCFVFATGWDGPFATIARKFLADPDWSVRELRSGHDVPIDMPDELAQLLIEMS